MNRLSHEKSPYLQQHADNPVDWFPWGTEAFERARETDKPVLVSIGYSSCHWCHVMAHESFEDEQTADRMNELLVSIKVDREERPDVDAIYMEAVQRLGVPGGWPLNVFLTPAGEPFWGGTYFPPVPSRGMPSWVQVVEALAEQYRDNRAHVDNVASQLTELLRAQATVQVGDQGLDSSVLVSAVRAAAPTFDWQDGGFGGAPKFPQPNALEFLLRTSSLVPEAESVRFVDLTLRAMADGGIFDQVGGGFHRYSVDATWTVPHFEKMLYDNALLARLYTDMWRVTGDARHRRVAEQTLDYVLNVLQAPEGGFFSSQDADSEGVEGKYYVWTPAEIEAVLPEQQANAVRLRYGVTDEGNFEGASILRVTMEMPRVAELLDSTEEQVKGQLQTARATLLKERDKRVPPSTDRKILVSWNALAIRALMEGGIAFDRSDFVSSAVTATEFVLQSMRRDGRLMRSYQDGLSDVPAFLEDYAFLIEALVTMYEGTAESSYFEHARTLAERMIELFGDEDTRTFFDTGADAAGLLVRPRSLFDNPIPSGVASASMGLLRLNSFAPDAGLEEWGVGPLNLLAGALASQPLHVSYAICALDLYVRGATQIAIVAGQDETLARDMAGTVWRAYLPNRALAVSYDQQGAPDIELLEDRVAVGGHATAYVCRSFVCRLPVQDVESLALQLQAEVLPPG